ncbi:MAG TPA: VTT domain-containing protein [Anaerolineales bacterium]|nr:VTT domain-containing protein [Anaerolineales bacterium]
MKSSLFLKLTIVAGTPALVWGSRGPLAAAWSWFSDREAVTATIDQMGLWGPLFLAILFVLQVFLAFIPGQALMVACGYLYGFWGGFLLSWLSLVIGGEAAFVLARRCGRTFAEKWIRADVLARWDRKSAGQGTGFYALMLVLPLIPNDAMCYVAGLGRISRIRFTIANLLGRGLACLFTSALGAFGGSIPWQGWVLLIAGLAAVGIAWTIARHRKPQLLAA